MLAAWETRKFCKASADMYILKTVKIRKRFVYQCLDNVKMYKYAKYQSIPWGSKVMNIFTKRP